LPYKMKRKNKIFICHDEGNIRDFDVRENMPVWREVKSFLEQFEIHTSEFRNKNIQVYSLSKKYLFYFKKIVEHYDPKIPELTYPVLCSLIESVGKLKFPRLGSKPRFVKAVKKYFNPRYASDPDFIRCLKEAYENDRCPFVHEAERLRVMTQVGSEAQFPLSKDKNGNYVLGALHLFYIAAEVAGNYLEEISASS